MSCSVACRTKEPVEIYVNAPSECGMISSDTNANTSFRNPKKTRKHLNVNCDTDKSKDSETAQEIGAGKDYLYIRVPIRRLSISTDTSSSSSCRRGSSLRGLSQSVSGLVSLHTSNAKVNSPVEDEHLYKMSPDSDQRVAVSKVKQIAEQILKDDIGDKEYDSYLAGEMAGNLSKKIKSKVKEMIFSRYKVICQVIIMDSKTQGLHAVSRCLWDTSSDNYTTATYSNNCIDVTAMIYSVYKE